MKPPTEDDPVEVAKLAAEVNRDIRDGNGAKHFEREIDDLHSIGARTRVENPDTPAELRRFCRDFRDALNSQLSGAGLFCQAMRPDGRGDGFALTFVDRQGRPFHVEYSFDEGIAAAVRVGDENMGREMIGEVAAKVIAARERYFARMQ